MFSLPQKLQNSNINMFIKDNQRIVYTLFMFLFAFIFGYIMWNRYSTMQSAKKAAASLNLVSSYDSSLIMSNDRLREEYSFWTKLSDMVNYSSTLKNDIKKAQEQRIKLSLPYNYFLHFLYVPSVNIWKNPFDGTIDTNLIGEKYLKNNPYGDIELIQQWTNFFKDMGTDKYNTITDISLGSLITQQSGGYFSLPLTVQFETPDRRSFLLLLSKLSITSYSENVSLINEFMFYLRENIKVSKNDEISRLLSKGELPSQVKTEDDLLGYTFYQWIKNDGKNIFIDQDIINKTIIKVAGCVDQDSKECLYMFREKYRSIPLMAYGIARENIDSVKGLQLFLQELPPLISLDNFSFDKKIVKGQKKGSEGYKGTISLRIYGKDISPKEVDEIADKLGGLCFSNKTRLSITYSIDTLNKLINQLGKDYSINEKRAKQLREMASYIALMSSEYQGLSNYKKVIKLFEIYRTIYEGNVCDLLSDVDELSDTINSHTLPVKNMVGSRIE